MDKFTNFVDAVDMLVRTAEDNMLKHEDHQSMVSKGTWLRDMATVSLTLPRRVGKTSYINKRARCADLIIVHNHEMKREYRDSTALVITLSMLDHLTRGRSQLSFNRVYVDEPRLVFTGHFSTDDLYAGFCDGIGSRACANMFIMLGT